MKRFNTLTIAIASLIFSITVMSGGVAGALPLLFDDSHYSHMPSVRS